MLERGKMDRNVIEMVGIDSLVPEEHLLRKIDRAVDFSRLYEMVEPLYSEEQLPLSVVLHSRSIPDCEIGFSL